MPAYVFKYGLTRFKSTAFRTLHADHIFGEDDVRKFEPIGRRTFENLDKSIQKLRAIYKVHPEWFVVPKPKSDKGKSVVDYPNL